MTKSEKATWLKALRSGEYKQSRGELVSKDTITGTIEGYCCLGVANDVCKLGIEIDQTFLEDNDGNYAFLSQEVQTFLANLNDSNTKARLKQLSIDAGFEGKLPSLHKAEDTKFGAGFKAIATFIEKYVLPNEANKKGRPKAPA